MKKHIVFVNALLLLFGILLSCDTKKSDSNEELLIGLLQDTTENGGSVVSDEACQSSSESTGVYTATINATDQDLWVLCDLSARTSHERSSSEWDLGFQRFKIQTNGGSSGDGAGAACNTELTSFETVDESTTCDFAEDIALSQEGGGGGGDAAVSWSGSEAFFDWYSYSDSHVLTSRDEIYLVRSGDGNTTFKVQVLDYYSGAGTPAYITIKWARIGD